MWRYKLKPNVYNNTYKGTRRTFRNRKTRKWFLATHRSPISMYIHHTLTHAHTCAHTHTHAHTPDDDYDDRIVASVGCVLMGSGYVYGNGRKTETHGRKYDAVFRQSSIEGIYASIIFQIFLFQFFLSINHEWTSRVYTAACIYFSITPGYITYIYIYIIACIARVYYFVQYIIGREI